MKNFTVFVHCASEYLTDYQSHGDGLICFSLLNELAKRNHQIFAYTRYVDISSKDLHLQVEAGGHVRVPFGSLVAWEHSWQANRWFLNLSKQHDIDLVWRMHPYGRGCPIVPKTLSKPLVVGPLFYRWPENEVMKTKSRFGISLQPLVSPLAQQGWHRTLQMASLIICATSKHTRAMQNQFPQAQVLCLPVIVEPPDSKFRLIRNEFDESTTLRLIFVANLLPHKNPLVFCETVRLLRSNGINVKAIILGEGSERSVIETYCSSQGLEEAICLKGKVPNSEVYNYLSNADLLISTSLGEPYGRSIVEAMAVGTPCICHNSGGPAEIIEHEVDGLLVEELNAKAFADAIAPVQANRHLWQHLSKNAIQKSKTWKSEIVISRLESALLQTCSIKS